MYECNWALGTKQIVYSENGEIAVAHTKLVENMNVNRYYNVVYSEDGEIDVAYAKLVGYKNINRY